MKIYYRLIRLMLVISVIFSVAIVSVYGYGNSGSSGSSGGSRGVTTSNIDPFENIVKYEVRSDNLIANESVEYSFTTPEFSIYQILVNGKENEYDVSVRVEDLINTSKYAKPAPGIVYRNENVGMGSVRVNYISVRFRLNNSWMEDNDLDESRHPYLLKWNGTMWLVLKTDIIGKDDTYTYLESPKAGNSRIGIFAISAPPKRIDTVVNTWQNTTSIENEEEIIPNIIEKRIEDDGIEMLSGFEIIVAIIGIILLSIYVTKKR